MTAPLINTTPVTLDACFSQLSRLGDLRETGRLTDAEYYAADAKLTARLLELKAEDLEHRMADAAVLVRLPEASAGCVRALETEADAELRFGLVLQDPDASAEAVNAAMAEWRSVKGYVYEEVGS